MKSYQPYRCAVKAAYVPKKRVKKERGKVTVATINIQGMLKTNKQTQRSMKSNTNILPDLPLTDCIHIHTYCGDLATAVLMKFVATRLTSEAIKKKLVTEITVGQLKEGFPYLHKRGYNECMCAATTNMMTCPIHKQKKQKEIALY